MKVSRVVNECRRMVVENGYKLEEFRFVTKSSDVSAINLHNDSKGIHIYYKGGEKDLICLKNEKTGKVIAKDLATNTIQSFEL